MASITEVLSLLRRVQSLRFNACSEAATGWDGVGTGTVTVSEPVTGVVVFEEAGIWQPNAADRVAIDFKNVFRWTVADGVLRLEHLRFGFDNPVLLFDMVPGEDGRWREVSPHQGGLLHRITGG